jgi:hypothetical protein
MFITFGNFYKLLKSGGWVYFDIGDSQYYNVYIPVYSLIEEIAQKNNLVLDNSILIRERISKNGMKLSQKLMVFRKD